MCRMTSSQLISVSEYNVSYELVNILFTLIALYLFLLGMTKDD